MTESFGARLRAARERQGVGLPAIAGRTKINIALFEGIERDDASRWPSGLFRRAFMRAYAAEIGLDPETTVLEFLQCFPDPMDEPHGAAKADSNDLEGNPLRLTLADEPSRLGRVHQLFGRLPRVSAAGIDLAIVIVAALVAFEISNRFWTPLTVATLGYYVGGVATLGNSFGGWVIERARTRVSAAWRPAPMQHGATAAAIEGGNLRQFPARRYRKAV
ncbi:MAG TPA: helix-turn-helix transcriptional regulator [Vicinamibacterales bacterium]|nr:helix-turn-helix transcriptional regulator [Vicinamibacterales bacterium]